MQQTRITALKMARAMAVLVIRTASTHLAHGRATVEYRSRDLRRGSDVAKVVATRVPSVVAHDSRHLIVVMS